MGNDQSNQWQHDISIPDDKWNLLCDLFFTYTLVHEKCLMFDENLLKVPGKPKY